MKRMSFWTTTLCMIMIATCLTGCTIDDNPMSVTEDELVGPATAIKKNYDTELSENGDDENGVEENSEKDEDEDLWDEYERVKQMGVEFVELYGVTLYYGGESDLSSVKNEEGTTLSVYDDQGTSVFVGVWYQDEHPEDYGTIVDKNHRNEDVNGVEYYTAENAETGDQYIAIPESRMYMTITGEGEWQEMWDDFTIQVSAPK